MFATYPPTPGSHSSNDEYVGLAVAGRYLLVLSMPLLEQSHTDLETAIAQPRSGSSPEPATRAQVRPSHPPKPRCR